MKRWKRIGKMKGVFLLAAAVAGSSAGIGGTLAYLRTETNQRANDFTAGEVKIALHEPMWEALPDVDGNGIPDVAEPMYPGQVISKDPKVENTGRNPAYVYLEVWVPKKEVIFVDPDTKKKEDSSRVAPLFTYAVNEGWTEIEVDESGMDADVHLYAYTAGEVLPGESTEALFDEVAYGHVLEGEIAPDTVLDIQVHALAVQSEWLKREGSPVGEIEDMTERLTAAYEIYLAEEARR